MPSLWQVIFLLFISTAFMHFLIAGGKTFVLEPMCVGAGVAQASFFGAVIVICITAVYHKIHPSNGAAASLILLGSLTLYEWARRTVQGLRFQAAFSDHVPDSLCEAGPYKHLRHPFYVSYMLAFAAALIALPTISTSVLLACNIAVFLYAAITDERAIAQSELATEYVAYKARVRRFIPRLRRDSAVTPDLE